MHLAMNKLLAILRKFHDNAISGDAVSSKLFLNELRASNRKTTNMKTVHGNVFYDFYLSILYRKCAYSEIQHLEVCA